MIIQIDTREHKQERERIESQFDSIGVEHFRSKLYVGDYMSLDNAKLCIDRKKDLLEVCGNVTQQHERFRSELMRSIDAGIKLIILIEHGYGIRCLGDVYDWHNPRLDEYEWIVENGRPKRVQKHPKSTEGPQLYKSLRTISKEYGVEIVFCNKNETGFVIYKLLGGK